MEGNILKFADCASLTAVKHEELLYWPSFILSESIIVKNYS